VGEAAEFYVAEGRRFIGYAEMFDGNLPEARAIFEELLAYHRRVASEGRNRNNVQLSAQLPMILVAYGALAYAEGNLDEALAALNEALLLVRASGDRSNLAFVLARFAIIALARGDVASALASWQEGAVHSIDLNTPIYLLECVEGIGAAYALGGEPARAAILFGAVRSFRGHTRVARLFICIDLYDDSMAEAAAALGHAEYDRLFQIGQGMTLEEALDAVNGTTSRIAEGQRTGYATDTSTADGRK
jgi:tetratricopeptide (TPR) repeat protein